MSSTFTLEWDNSLAEELNKDHSHQISVIASGKIKSAGLNDQRKKSRIVPQPDDSYPEIA
jgi:short-subunit dehydrogenase